MPLFGSRRSSTHNAPPVTTEATPRRSGTLFGRHSNAPPATTEAAPRHSGTFFGRHSNAPAATSTTHSTSPQRSSGIFGRNRSTSPPLDKHHAATNGHHSGGGLLHRHEDPSISAARQRVMHAEGAERDADRALLAARAAVRDARQEVKRLEREAAEEARLAKLKQSQAKNISKRAKPLGRHM